MAAISAATERQFLTTVAPCIPDLRRYALSLTRNAADADDLVQETTLRATLKLHLWQPGTNMIAWLIEMMRRLHISQNLTGARNRAITTPIADWDVATPATQLQWIELREVGACWPRLSKDHRTVLELVAIGGASYDEAAATLGVPLGTIRSRLSRARICLREQHVTAH